MLLKEGKIIPKLAYKRIFTLEKEKRGEGGGKKTRRKSEYIVVKFGVTCRMRIQVKLKKKKKEILQGILHLYYNFQHSCYSICIFSNNPLLINSSNFTKSLIIHCRCTFFPSGSRFRITHVNAG